MPRLLDDSLLAEYDAMLHAQRGAMPDNRPASLTDVEIDEVAASSGFALPNEARIWYRWHDGSRWDIFYGRAQLSLSDAVQRSRESREEDENWRAGWLQATNEKPYILFDCDGPIDAPVPVWHYDYWGELPTRPQYESIGEMLLYWMSLVEQGRAFWHEGSWKLREPVPDEVGDMLGGVPTD